MWQLRFEYTHKDCLYSHMIKKLNLVMYAYPLSHYPDKTGLCVNGIQIVKGNPLNIKKYIQCLKEHENIKRIEIISGNAFFYQTLIGTNIPYYQAIYNPRIFYLSPIIHQSGKETFFIASWDKKLLESLIDVIRNSKNTSYFKLLQFRRRQIKSIFLPQILPNLTSKQQELMQLAYENGYFEYPRKTDLNKLSKEIGLAKSTVHETLKRAEARLLEHFI